MRSQSRNVAANMRAAQMDRDRNRVEPRYRAHIDYSVPGRFYGNHPHYFGYCIHTLPPHHVHHHYWGCDYYYYDGLWYRPRGHAYYVCRPPYGYYFERSLYELELAACHFAYYNTLYRTYNAIDENYATIQEQNRTIAENNALIAAQNEQIEAFNKRSERSFELANSLGLIQSYAAQGQQYYYNDGIFFIQSPDGQYQTIVPPAGALIEELPDDYEVITLNGVEYYKVDDTVYRMAVSEGKPYFEVLGQMPAAMAARYEKN